MAPSKRDRSPFSGRPIDWKGSPISSATQVGIEGIGAGFEGLMSGLGHAIDHPPALDLMGTSYGELYDQYIEPQSWKDERAAHESRRRAEHEEREARYAASADPYHAREMDAQSAGITSTDPLFDALLWAQPAGQLGRVMTRGAIRKGQEIARRIPGALSEVRTVAGGMVPVPGPLMMVPRGAGKPPMDVAARRAARPVVDDAAVAAKAERALLAAAADDAAAAGAAPVADDLAAVVAAEGAPIAPVTEASLRAEFGSFANAQAETGVRSNSFPNLAKKINAQNKLSQRAQGTPKAPVPTPVNPEIEASRNALRQEAANQKVVRNQSIAAAGGDADARATLKFLHNATAKEMRKAKIDAIAIAQRSTDPAAKALALKKARIIEAHQKLQAAENELRIFNKEHPTQIMQKAAPAATPAATPAGDIRAKILGDNNILVDTVVTKADREMLKAAGLNTEGALLQWAKDIGLPQNEAYWTKTARRGTALGTKWNVPDRQAHILDWMRRNKMDVPGAVGRRGSLPGTTTTAPGATTTATAKGAESNIASLKAGNATAEQLTIVQGTENPMAGGILKSLAEAEGIVVAKRLPVRWSDAHRKLLNDAMAGGKTTQEAINEVSEVMAREAFERRFAKQISERAGKPGTVAGTTVDDAVAGKSLDDPIAATGDPVKTREFLESRTHAQLLNAIKVSRAANNTARVAMFEGEVARRAAVTGAETAPGLLTNAGGAAKDAAVAGWGPFKWGVAGIGGLGAVAGTNWLVNQAYQKPTSDPVPDGEPGLLTEDLPAVIPKDVTAAPPTPRAATRQEQTNHAQDHRDKVHNEHVIGGAHLDDQHVQINPKSRAEEKRAANLYNKAFYLDGVVTHHPTRPGSYIVVDPKTWKRLEWGPGASARSARDSRKRRNEANILANPEKYRKAFERKARREMNAEYKKAIRGGDRMRAAMIYHNTDDPKHPMVMLAMGAFRQPETVKGGRYSRSVTGGGVDRAKFFEYQKEYDDSFSKPRDLTVEEQAIFDRSAKGLLNTGRISALQTLIGPDREGPNVPAYDAEIAELLEDQKLANQQLAKIDRTKQRPGTQTSKFMPDVAKLLPENRAAGTGSPSLLGPSGEKRRREFVDRFGKYHPDIASEFESGVYGIGYGQPPASADADAAVEPGTVTHHETGKPTKVTPGTITDLADNVHNRGTFAEVVSDLTAIAEAYENNPESVSQTERDLRTPDTSGVSKTWITWLEELSVKPVSITGTGKEIKLGESPAVRRLFERIAIAAGLDINRQNEPEGILGHAGNIASIPWREFTTGSARDYQVPPAILSDETQESRALEWDGVMQGPPWLRSSPGRL